MDGTIINANDNFLARSAIRWTRSRASITACSSSRRSATARPIAQFWAALNRGQYQAAEYKRIGKGGKEVWIQASYNPILDLNGKPFKVVKYATDITRQVLVRMGNERVRGMMELVAAGIGGTERLGAGDLRSHDQVPRDRDERGGAGRLRRRARRSGSPKRRRR